MSREAAWKNLFILNQTIKLRNNYFLDTLKQGYVPTMLGLKYLVQTVTMPFSSSPLLCLSPFVSPSCSVPLSTPPLSYPHSFPLLLASLLSFFLALSRSLSTPWLSPYTPYPLPLPPALFYLALIRSSHHNNN